MEVRVIENGQECTGRLTRMLFDRWTELKRDKIAPLMSDFDYLDHAELLGSLAVFEAQPGSPKTKVKFAGSDLADLLGRQSTSASINQVYGQSLNVPDLAEFTSNSMKILARCRQECQPLINGPKNLALVQKDFVRFESLMVPFVDEGGEVVQLVSVVDVQNISDGFSGSDEYRS